MCYFRLVWSKKEDRALRAAVKKYKREYWIFVADYVNETLKNVPPKTPKQCRERWINQLNSQVNLSPLEDWEEKKVLELHKKVGNRWSYIAGELKYRTDNIVKNWFLCRMRKIARCIRKKSVSLVFPRNITELVQELYIIEHIYKYYLSTDRYKNIAQTLSSQTRKRKNEGDRYINKMIERDELTIDKLSTFVKLLLKRVTFSYNKQAIQEYKYLTSITLSSESHSCVPNTNIRTETITASLCPIADITDKVKIELPLPDFSLFKLPAHSFLEKEFKPSFNFAVYCSHCLDVNGSNVFEQ
jgi:hypothetical protein